MATTTSEPAGNIADAVDEVLQDHTHKAVERSRYNIVDHLSHFSGLAVAQFYILCAAVTLYEVVARYVFNAPTQWAFEVVMVLCASAWMISAGYVTLKQSHIGITVFYVLARDRTRWILDLFAMTVGVVALFLLIADATSHALSSIDIIERAGSGFNSPQPMLLKTVLVVGAALYLAQLLVNLHRHFENRLLKTCVVLVSLFIALRILSVVAAHYFGEDSLGGGLDLFFVGIGEALDPTRVIDARAVGTGTVTIIIVAALVLLMMTGMPLGIVTLIVSVICAVLFFGPKGLYLVSTNAFGLLEKYPLVAVPLFVLMASILERAGIAEDLFDAMSIFAGNLRGGVAVQTVAVAVVLAAMSGVMGGEIVMLGLVALPQMLRLGYDRKLTVGVICASGALATLIPPSIVMIVYGLSADVAIGDLFLAGAVPGLMLASFYASFVLIRCYLNPSLAPTAAEVAEMSGGSTNLSGHRKTAVALCILLIACVLGSIYAGIASVTEAAGVGVFGAIAVAAVRNRFNWGLLQTALAGTMNTVGTIIWLILGAVSFVGIYNLIGGADFMRSLFTGLGLPAFGVIFVMMAILVVLGTFMEWIAIVFITVPVFAPVIVDLAPELGLDPAWAAIWFGVLFVMNIQIYFLSPPFGPACFWLKSVAPPDITLQEIFIAVLPFIVLQVIGLLLVMFFPEIALFLPKALSG
ncbi:MAG: TRAP transporter large permease subunit [Kiloniellales bacterium]|nr:TRAP transporter large permease subunit [Kiloniellales bacterium]